MAFTEISNIRFLVGQQIRVIEELDRRGLASGAARDLLARLMRRHEDLRRSFGTAEPLRAA